MASRQEWCADKLAKLLQEELRVTTLNEIKQHLETIPSHEASQTVNLLDLPVLFDCLNDSNRERVELTCEVLSLCMSNLNIGESTDRCGIPLERALIHPYAGVKLMALTELERSVKNDDVLVALCKRVSLLSNVIKCVADNDLAVAKKASRIINLVGVSDKGIKRLVSSNLLKLFHEVMDLNEVIRLRIYDIFVDISKESKSSFEELESSGLISPILNELGNDDILLRMNIIELLTQLGLSEHGFQYLERNGVLSKLANILQDNDPVMIQLSEPGLLKFYGNMAHWKPSEMISKHSEFLNRIFSNLESDDFTIFGVSLDTLGHIGLTNEGKIALETRDYNMNIAIRCITSKLGTMPTEIRVRALNCLENLLRVTNLDNQVTKITKRWFFLMGENPMDIVLKYAKNPFTEIRVAGFGIINAIAPQLWGQDTIKNTPGLVEFLLDRGSETIKECKEAKYDVIVALSESAIFDNATSTKLQAYVKEGPFYVQGITEVAVEGNE